VLPEEIHENEVLNAVAFRVRFVLLEVLFEPTHKPADEFPFPISVLNINELPDGVREGGPIHHNSGIGGGYVAAEGAPVAAVYT
jgi:hypothetical protein